MSKYMNIHNVKKSNFWGFSVILRQFTLVVAMLLTKLTCWKPFSLKVTATSQRSLAAS